MPIQIPADITVVTLKDQAQRWTEGYARSVFSNASALLQDRAQIQFSIGAFESVTEEMPDGAQSDQVDDAGFHYLVATHRAGLGVRILLVDRTTRPELGGEAREQTRVCLVKYGSDAPSTGRMLAHELGHLLGLEHVDGPSGPGNERLVAERLRNLMYPGALNPDAVLTATQVQQARSSTLARRFGGP